MIHEAASVGYSTAAEIYVRGRPGYPPEASAWLRETIGLGPSRKVLEVGAGTGKFIPLLRETGATVLALEPVEAMRAQIVRLGIETVNGTAEQIDLPDASIDAIICAQAFHWFATRAALAEFRRVLKPGGVLGLIWNGRDVSVPWVARWGEIVDRHQGDGPRYQSGAWRRVFPAPGLATLAERHARNAHTGPAEHVIVDRTLSTSFISALPADQRHPVETQVRALIAATPELAGGEVSVPYETLMAAFRRSDG